MWNVLMSRVMGEVKPMWDVQGDGRPTSCRMSREGGGQTHVGCPGRGWQPYVECPGRGGGVNFL